MSTRRRVDFVECKTLGHQWDIVPGNLSSLNGWDSALSLRCMRCEAERMDYLDYLGEVGERRYVYPEGYRDAKDIKPSRAAMRLMLVKR